MSISTLESRTSRDALAQMQAEDEARANTVAMLKREFLSAAARAEGSAIASFAGTTTDYANRQPGGGYGKRLQTVGEVVHDALDRRDFVGRAMDVLLRAAQGRGTQRDAQELLEEVAECWADRNADEYL